MLHDGPCSGPVPGAEGSGAGGPLTCRGRAEFSNLSLALLLLIMSARFQKSCEHALAEWVNDQIAEMVLGIASPSQEQAIDFIVSWAGPVIAVLVAYAIFSVGIWCGKHQPKLDFQASTAMSGAKGNISDANHT